MGVSKIEQLIEDIYAFIESCKSPAFMQNKVTVPKDELYDLLDELRFSTPDEIKRYQKILANREAILADAKGKADDMVEKAKQQIGDMVNEREIVQQAYRKAEEIVDYATNEANRMLERASREAEQMYVNATVYSEEKLTEAENMLKNAYSSSKNKYDALLVSIKGNLEIIENDKRELREYRMKLTGDSPVGGQEMDGVGADSDGMEAYDEVAAEEEEYDFDGDTFTEGLDID